MARKAGVFGKAALLLAVSALCALTVTGCAPAVRIDDGSPRCAGTAIEAGSDLTEGSQYAEARLVFDAPLATSGPVADDVEVLLDGKPPDGRTIAVDVRVEGADLVVRLAPTQAAANGGSVYFALHDGQLSVGPRRDDGALPHLTAADSGATAVLDGACTFTVPTGMRIGDIVREGPSVTFTVQQFAQLRCCAWFSFGEGLPLVKVHNHAFYRDTCATAAERLAATVNADYADAYTAVSDGAQVTVTARDRSYGALVAQLAEGPDVDLSTDASAEPDSTGEGA